MKQRTRRLWLGDWQRDDRTSEVAGREPADSVLLTPPEDEEAAPTRDDGRSARRWVAGLLVVAALIGVLFAISRGTASKPVALQSLQAPQTQVPPTQIPQSPQGGPQGFGGPDLTGADAIRAARAAVAKFPGGVERVTAGPGGGYGVP